MGEARRRKLAGDVVYDETWRRETQEAAIRDGLIRRQDTVEAGRQTRGESLVDDGCLGLAAVAVLALASARRRRT